MNNVVPALILVGVAWDLAGLIARAPTWWPTVTWVLLAAAVAVGCLGLLVQFFERRRGEPRPRGTGRRLLAIGLLLTAWLLRGHPEIPPDPPLIAAAVVAALIHALPLIGRRRAGDVR